MSNLVPPLVQPVQRLGSPYWPNKRPKVIVSPADVVDIVHGTSLQLFDLQLDMLHGLNLNDPAKWRSKCSSTFGKFCLSSAAQSSWIGRMFGRR